MNKKETKDRESFSSRLGFILISAGCAIGLGNVWRFPYIVGKYGGAIFVLVYLVFLVILALPIMTMEFAVGRASRKSITEGFKALEPKKSKWHIFGYFALAGNYLLMMFYTTIAGWMLAYCVKMANGSLVGLTSEQISSTFSTLTSNPVEMIFWTFLVILICFGICSLGFKNGVERITKALMLCLLAIMLVLSVRALTLPGAYEGIKFYLMPNMQNFIDAGFFEVIFAAMGQAFFTLSVGIGSMAIFGSYQNHDRTLLGESVYIMVLDTFVALVSGLIIFPACFAYNVAPDQGPGLIFITLPHVFNAMPYGNVWGTFFFVFMSFAALSTVIAIFQNIVAYFGDSFGWRRGKAIALNIVLITLLSLPCVLGFNVWENIAPLGAGSTILDFEDFIVSNNLLPLGALVYCLFCVTKYGWGFDNFIQEANIGMGIKIPKCTRVYLKYILPIIIIYIFVQGYIIKF